MRFSVHMKLTLCILVCFCGFNPQKEISFKAAQHLQTASTWNVLKDFLKIQVYEGDWISFTHVLLDTPRDVQQARAEDFRYRSHAGSFPVACVHAVL